MMAAAISAVMSSSVSSSLFSVRISSQSKPDSSPDSSGSRDADAPMAARSRALALPSATRLCRRSRSWISERISRMTRRSSSPASSSSTAFALREIAAGCVSGCSSQRRRQRAPMEVFV